MIGYIEIQRHNEFQEKLRITLKSLKLYSYH